MKLIGKQYLFAGGNEFETAMKAAVADKNHQTGIKRRNMFGSKRDGSLLAE